MDRKNAPWFEATVYDSDGHAIACRTVQGLMMAQTEVIALRKLPGAVRSIIAQNVAFGRVIIEDVRKPAVQS